MDEKNQIISSPKNRELLRKELQGLTHTEYHEIFNIIKNDNIQFTENRNGVFINLKNLSDESINKIYEFIDFSKHNKKNLEILEEKQKEQIKNSQTQKMIKSYSLNINDDNIMNNIDRTVSNYNIPNKKSATNENFTFQNFIDKFTITNMKMFPENERIIYPNLKQFKCNYTGVKYRLLKRCREISKMSNEKFMTPLFFEMEDGQLNNKVNISESLFDEEDYDRSSDEDEADDE
jgi:hypothetical protein